MSEMNCRELVELVTDYLDGTLDWETERRFTDHLTRCDGCVAYFEQIRQTIQALGDQPAEDLPGEIQDALLHIFRHFPATGSSTEGDADPGT